MRIISWNINGIKAHYDALQQLVNAYEPDILCLQKVKSSKGIEAFPIEGYKPFDISTYRSRYYGVGTYYRSIDNPLMNFPNDLAAEGHFQALRLKPQMPVLFNIYAPFSNPIDPKYSEARKKWDDILFLFAKDISSHTPLIMCGDFNVVNQSYDTWTRNCNHDKPCYYSWERANFSRLLHQCDLVDAFRELHPQEMKFTYFDSKGDYRASNQGDRIDYFLISRSLLPYVTRCDIIEDITASNSNPIILDIDYSVSALPPGYRKSSQGLNQKASIPNAVDTETISINEAARWVAAMAAMDGVVSPNERKLIKDFAGTYGIEAKSLYRMAYAIANNVDIPEVEFISRRAKVGRMFEDFVVSLCSDKSVFKLIAWRGDKINGEVYALENLLPDLHLRHRLGAGEVEYYIECKYRSSWGDDGIDLSGQYVRYHNAAKDHKMELFIALGVGGTPSAPDEFFLVPGRMVKLDKKIDRDRFIKCQCPKDPEGFQAYINHYFNKRVFKNL